MTTLVTPIPVARPMRPLLPVLAAHEARRLLLHPVMVIGFLLFFLMCADMVLTGTTKLEAFEGVGSALGFYPGVFAILAANLVATRDVRAGSEDLLAPVPARPAERVAALSLAALVPAVVSAVLVIALDTYFLVDGRLAETPTLGHLAQGPVAVLGGSLLGIMLGVWLPARGTAVIALVAMVATNVWLSSTGDHGRLFGPIVQWGEWGPFNGDVWVGYLPGDPAAHIVYLLGLCGMAAFAAQFRVTHRRIPVVTAGLLSLAVAVAGGIIQLP